MDDAAQFTAIGDYRSALTWGVRIRLASGEEIELWNDGAVGIKLPAGCTYLGPAIPPPKPKTVQIS